MKTFQKETLLYFHKETCIEQHHLDELKTVIWTNEKTDFHREAAYWKIHAAALAETANKDHNKAKAIEWGNKVKEEFATGSSWAHKITKVVEPRQHKPVDTSTGPSMAATDVLEY